MSSGLPGKIRSSVISEQYDLAGYSESRISELVKDAFSSPITGPTEMIRHTFVVGGGKAVRSKYDEQMTKWFTQALRDIGYTEDRSAAETLDSQGTFKTQHDTGANLKYVIVYPKLSLDSNEPTNRSVPNESTDEVPNSPEYILRCCELSTFQEIIHAKTHSWRQRKTILKLIENMKKEFAEIESKLFQALPLSTEESKLYNASVSLDEKFSWLQDFVKQMMDSGKLTTNEILGLKAQVTENLDSCRKELDALVLSNSSQTRIEQLNSKIKNLKIKLESIESINTPVRYKLHQHKKIVELRVELLKLEKLEEGKRSMSLSLNDLKTLEQKPEIEIMIENMETASRGWFLDENDFKDMCNLAIADALSEFGRKSNSQIKKVSESKSYSSSFGNPVKATKPASVTKLSGQTKKSKSGFAALGNDSDSD